jgi:hypothetical protein
MSKRNLQQVIDQANFTATIFGGKVYDINALTQTDADLLCATINNQLSPENLTCDGELRGAQVQARFNTLAGALKELHRMGFTVTVEEL